MEHHDRRKKLEGEELTSVSKFNPPSAEEKSKPRLKIRRESERGVESCEGFLLVPLGTERRKRPKTDPVAVHIAVLFERKSRRTISVKGARRLKKS